uniref:EGF-like domain-containing protein n=1 Tax=Panagrolaimus davidi TaxID=227884 RepID=A0A914PNR4_9BILA
MRFKKVSILLILLFGNVFADYSPLKWLISQTSYSNFLTGENILKSIGDSCERSLDCVSVSNSICIEGKCQCQKGHFSIKDETKNRIFICKKALDFHQSCRNVLSGIHQCREPFVCSKEGICDCPDGFSPAKDNTRCHRICEPYHVLVKSKIDNSETCAPLLDLGERCSYNEQCSTRYAQCLGSRCQCISGTIRRHQQCVTVQQCPLGEAPLENGNPLVCDRNTLKCPDGNYCLFAQFTDSRGHCCPTMKINCPVRSPLSYGCANCPWETHHCFTYSIGTHQQSMCCPNDCPRNLPIRNGDKCYAIAGHLSHCSVDEQCLSVQNSVCLSTNANETTKICQCPINHILIDGICQKVSKLGGECEKDSDCFIGSNTVCRNGYCKCSEGFMPEPNPFEWKTSTAFSIEHCIAEPTCPSIHVLLTIEHYEDCSPKSGCSEGKFCHQWFEDPLKERNYSLCCPIPT